MCRYRKWKRVSKIKWKIIRKSKIVQLMETGMLILAGLMQAGSEGKWREGKVRAREGGKGERRKGKRGEGERWREGEERKVKGWYVEKELITFTQSVANPLPS